ncbi:hypothetical protein [Agromyces sp. Leaf222]|uniref:hypothetical protein n=1 Tax=Agromyces sp. Leaf222 TaxID=1735688 RepID=UPI0006F8877A|nr:hypothetical protein [Agromyces sp. Leaf222]KQM82265.1 hypothetical protein ASE68_02340 [Agromyces sp. Leaf222]
MASAVATAVIDERPMPGGAGEDARRTRQRAVTAPWRPVDGHERQHGQDRSPVQDRRDAAAKRREARRRLDEIRDHATAAVMRRVLTTLISLFIGIAVFQLFAPRFDAPVDAAWHDRHAGAILIGVCAAVGVLVALTIASASRAGVELMHGLGIRSTPGNRAVLAAGSWFGVAALGVHFSAAAFNPVPGGQWVVAVVLGGGLALAVFCLHRVAVHDHAYRTFNLAALTLAAGAIASMSLTGTGPWWALNFSTLGTTDDAAAFSFNAGAVLSGLAMVMLARALTSGLASPRFGAPAGGIRALRVFIVLLGLCLAGVGLVPIDTATVLHNGFALGAAVCFAVPALGMRLLVPAAPLRLIVMSVVFVVVEAGAMVLYDGLHIFSLTVFEIIAFSLIFIWLIAITVMSREPGTIRATATATDAAGAALAAVHVAHRTVARRVHAAMTEASTGPAGPTGSHPSPARASARLGARAGAARLVARVRGPDVAHGARSGAPPEGAELEPTPS